MSKGERFVRFDAKLDRAAFGPEWLRNPQIAGLVQREILAIAERGRGVVHSYVTMPNHVHVLLDPRVELRTITQAVKGRSAKTANALLQREGFSFWQQESFDHWVRTASSFGKIQRYIAFNPVAAGLTKRPEDWPWSSAHVA